MGGVIRWENMHFTYFGYVGTRGIRPLLLMLQQGQSVLCNKLLDIASCFSYTLETYEIIYTSHIH